MPLFSIWHPDAADKSVEPPVPAPFGVRFGHLRDCEAPDAEAARAWAAEEFPSYDAERLLIIEERAPWYLDVEHRYGRATAIAA